MAILPTPTASFQQVPVQANPFLASSSLCAVCIWSAIQPSFGSLILRFHGGLNSRMGNWHEHPSSHAFVHIFYHEDCGRSLRIQTSLGSIAMVEWEQCRLSWYTPSSLIFFRLTFYISDIFQGHWHEIKFLSTPFCALGYSSWNEDDTGRHWTTKE